MNDQAQNLRKLVNERQNADKSSEPIYGDALLDQAGEGNCRVIAITSGKGGVGKTNLTVNLAIALAMRGKKVLIIDADLGMANVDVLLGTSSKYNLLHLVREDMMLQDVLSEGPYGIKYLSGGSGIEKLANLDYPELKQITDKLYQCEKFADIILLDTGAGLGKNVLNFLLAADEVLLVTTPEPTAMTDAYAIMKAYSVYAENPYMRIIVNRVYDDGEGSSVFNKLIKTADKFLNLPIFPLGEIYEDRNLMKAVKAQKPLLISYPNTISAKCIKAIALNLLEEKDVVVGRGLRGFLERFISFLHR